MAREFTNKLIAACEDGDLDPMTILRELVGFMSESDVQEFCENEGYFEPDVEEEEECLFEEGDVVEDGYGDVGTVVEIDESDEEYPVKVMFKGAEDTCSYTKIGWYFTSNSKPALNIHKI